MTTDLFNYKSIKKNLCDTAPSWDLGLFDEVVCSHTLSNNTVPKVGLCLENLYL